ncbi:hypothetical protein G6M89_14295 [Natronolimnobius sp. AArcel1]|uniref:hypothetical protein n=1 Tax=Natronolimnobius sp. AArcel1 TaxID=1679093 RepID=UPI0013EA59FD|nr:hypothetical protein [Natronolimnobius sp. AArcel1]NGM70164.1 hypothetical protein [Natronolimnobius sp. AArcel1]
MPTGPVNTLGKSDGGGDQADGDDNSRRPPAATGSSRGLTRRHALAAVGLVSLSTTAGCVDSVASITGNQASVEPESPGDDPDGTPGEFYYLLEQNDISVDELYHDTEENTLSLFYESDAEDEVESDDEIGIIYQVYSGGLLERGSDVQALYTEVVDGFDGQTTGWGIETEWIELLEDGEIDENQLWSAIVESKAYEDDDADGEDSDGNTTVDSTPEAETDTDGDGDGNGDDIGDDDAEATTDDEEHDGGA